MLSMKTCRKCGLEYPATTLFFYVYPRMKDGLDALCKPCHKAAERQWREQNHDRDLQRHREYYRANRDTHAGWQKADRKLDPGKYRAQHLRYIEINREAIRERRLRARLADPEKECAQARVRYRRKVERERANRSPEPEPTPSQRRCRERMKRWLDAKPGRRLSSSVSSLIWHSIRHAKAGRHWESLVGYTLPELMAHLEAQFRPGMTWDNYGDWHLDHIRPVASFTFSTPDDPEFKECWSLSNLQPLWASENCRKNAKWPGAAT